MRTLCLCLVPTYRHVLLHQDRALVTLSLVFRGFSGSPSVSIVATSWAHSSLIPDFAHNALAQSTSELESWRRVIEQISIEGELWSAFQII